MKEALLYRKQDDGLVHCYLCSHHCRIKEKQFGFCGVRQNVGGVLYTHAYGEVIAAHVDPVEKKPLYHFLPGSKSFSVATIGCNFRCGFCQNWEISQASFKEGRELGGDEFSPEEIVEGAVANSCRSIAYTYTEPTIFFEYAFDTAQIAKKQGLYNIFVTNGYMTGDMLEAIRPYLDAANVDLKFFRDQSYKTVCSGSLQPVLDSIRLMRKMDIWVEVTTLVVPGLNDSKKELSDIAGFIAGVDTAIPWHISRYHPDYKYNKEPPTPETTLAMAAQLGRDAGLDFVYVGNAAGVSDDTYCPMCKKLLIRRKGFDVYDYNIEDGKCVSCAATVAGLFDR